MLWIFIGFLICAIGIMVFGGGQSVQHKSRSTARRPAPGGKSLSDIPPQMHTYHSSEINLYRQRRKALGKPWEEPASTAVIKYFEFELRRMKKRVVRLTPDTRLDGLSVDEIDQAELMVALESHYDFRVQIPEGLVTLGEISEYIDSHAS